MKVKSTRVIADSVTSHVLIDSLVHLDLQHAYRYPATEKNYQTIVPPIFILTGVLKRPESRYALMHGYFESEQWIP